MLIFGQLTFSDRRTQRISSKGVICQINHRDVIRPTESCWVRRTWWEATEGLWLRSPEGHLDEIQSKDCWALLSPLHPEPPASLLYPRPRKTSDLLWPELQSSRFPVYTQSCRFPVYTRLAHAFRERLIIASDCWGNQGTDRPRGARGGDRGTARPSRVTGSQDTGGWGAPQASSSRLPSSSPGPVASLPSPKGPG